MVPKSDSAPDIPMGGPMSGPEPPMPMDNPPLDDPNDQPPMTDEDPNMDIPDEQPPMTDEDPAPQEGNPELNGIMDKLDTEKQAAVIKYAKSMVNDNGEDDKPKMTGDNPSMPMEGKQSLSNLINEIINNVLEDETNEDDDRRDKKIKNKKVTQGNPFISKR